MRLSFTVDEFCQTHGISRATFYKLCRNDSGPQVMKAGKRTLVSHEAATDWRRRMEDAARQRAHEDDL